MNRLTTSLCRFEGIYISTLPLLLLRFPVLTLSGQLHCAPPSSVPLSFPSSTPSYFTTLVSPLPSLRSTSPSLSLPSFTLVYFSILVSLLSAFPGCCVIYSTTLASPLFNVLRVLICSKTLVPSVFQYPSLRSCWTAPVHSIGLISVPVTLDLCTQRAALGRGHVTLPSFWSTGASQDCVAWLLEESAKHYVGNSGSRATIPSTSPPTAVTRCATAFYNRACAAIYTVGRHPTLA